MQGWHAASTFMLALCVCLCCHKRCWETNVPLRLPALSWGSLGSVTLRTVDYVDPHSCDEPFKDGVYKCAMSKEESQVQPDSVRHDDFACKKVPGQGACGKGIDVNLFSFLKKYRRGVPLTPEQAAGYAQFRASMGDGDHVDYYVDGRWKHGVIRSKRETEIRIIPEADTTLHRTTQQTLSEDDDYTDDVLQWNEADYLFLAPCDSLVSILRPKMERWRTELAVGGRCDVLDSVNKWYACTIVETVDEWNRIKVHYDNWNVKFDEWVAKDELRLQPFRTRERGGRESGGVYGLITDVQPVIIVEDDPDDAFALF